MKITLKRFKDRFEQAEERINELDDGSIEIIKFEEQKEKRMKDKQNPGALWNIIKNTNISIMGITEVQEKEKGTERTVDKIMAENFINFMKNINVYIQ